MLKNLTLSNKFNLLLIVVVVAGIVLSGMAFSSVLNQNAKNEVTIKALLLMETISAVRDYTNDRVNPLLEPRLDKEKRFLAEMIPSYTAKEVFKNFLKNTENKNLSYKDATLNPTNLEDKADRFETQIINNFRENLELKQLSDYYSLPDEKLFYIARPIIVKEASCLRCHSTPEAAPKSQIATYGNKHGFNWKLNEVIGAQVIYVPAKEIIQRAQSNFMLFIGIVTAAFITAIAITNVLLTLAVIRPVKQIVKVANEISTGNMNAEFERDTNDEIGMLSTAFNRMKISIALAMDMLNQRQN